VTFDRKTQASNWRSDADEDIEFAGECYLRGKPKYGLFLTHLALEKSLKGLVCLVTGDEPPKIHNLVQLAKLAEVPLTEDQMRFLGKLNEFNITGRYNIPLAKLPEADEAADLYQQGRRYLLG